MFNVYSILLFLSFNKHFDRYCICGYGTSIFAMKMLNGYKSSRNLSCCWLALLCASFLSIFFTSQQANGYLINSRRFGDMQSLVNTQPKWASKMAQVPAFVAEKKDFAPTIRKAGGAFGELNKFGGSGARNCYFSPVSCMILHDMPKYKKLIEINYGGMQK